MLLDHLSLCRLKERGAVGGPGLIALPVRCGRFGDLLGSDAPNACGVSPLLSCANHLTLRSLGGIHVFVATFTVVASSGLGHPVLAVGLLIAGI
jgi:hypothetical protein